MADPHAKPAPAAGVNTESNIDIFFVFKILGFLFFAVFIIWWFLKISNKPELYLPFLQKLYIAEFILGVIFLVLVGFVLNFMIDFAAINRKIGDIYMEKYKPEGKKEIVNILDEKLERVKKHIYSTNNSELRLGIIELDNILRELLLKNNYLGETVAEQLKNAEGKLKNLDNAWEAHKVRNKIAHEGMAFEVSQHEAERVYKLYIATFAELGN